MGGHARQHGLVPRRQPEPPRRAETPRPAPASVVRDPFAPAAASNGQIAHDLASSRHAVTVPAAAGNGTRVLYMPPEIITAHVPNEPRADDASAAQRKPDAVPRAPADASNAERLQNLQPLVNDPRDPNLPNADDVARREVALRQKLQEVDRKYGQPGSVAVLEPADAPGKANAGGKTAPKTTSVEHETLRAQPASKSARQPPAPPDVAANRGDASVRTNVVRGRGSTGKQAEAPTEAELATLTTRVQEDAAAEAKEVRMEPMVVTARPPKDAGDVQEGKAPAAAPARRGGGKCGEGGGVGGDPRVVVQRWRGGVSAAGSGMPQRNMSAASGGPARVKGAADMANQTRDRQRKGLPDEATANIEAPPQVEKLPAPPASNPIPEKTAAVEAASNKLLPQQTLPLFIQSPLRHVASGVLVGANWPQLGQRPVPNDVFQMIVAGTDKLAQISEDPENSERKRIEDARTKLEAPIKPGAQIADGVAAPLVDSGPKPPKPLPKGLKTPVASVVARLLADIDGAAGDVVKRMRILAYPRGVLNDKYPDIGGALNDQVSPRMNTDLREIAASAGASGEELDGLVADRKKELDKAAQETQQELAKTGGEAKDSVGESGQEMLNAIEGTRQATDEEIIRKQEETSGGNDPAVINARRDLVIKWVRNHVTGQTTNYQKAGEKREGELGLGQQQRINAYNALGQREEYQGLNPKPPFAHDRTKPDIVKQLAEFAAATRAWTRERGEGVRAVVGPLITTARTTSKENRDAVETAGNDAIKAARTWAEDRILEGKSWWERFKAALDRWFGDSQEANEVWSVRRTEETRNAIASDLVTINDIQAAVARGATQEELLQTQGLTQDQRAIIVEFFQQPAGTHPLDFAALLLRRNLAAQYLDLGRAAFEKELLAKPDGEADTLNDIQRTVRPSFDAGKIAETVHAQLDNFDSDEAAILKSLEGVSAFEGAIVRKLYRMRFSIDMDFAMAQALDSDEQDQANLRLKGEGAAADAAALDYAFGIINTDEKAIMDLLRGRSQEQIAAIKAEYKKRYGKDLDVALNDNLDEGNEQDQAGALMKGDKEAADTIAIDEAMRGGLFGWGTDNEEIEATYKRVHDEVLALAQRDGWNSEQMKAELRRRTVLIEKKFGEKYKDVEEYRDPSNPNNTILQNAISSEMDSGPERDLANALRTDDPIAADAARIEIERQGLWASDEKINNVLTNQYERALQETRLDQEPARQVRVNRLRRELSNKKPKLDEEQISIEVMKLEREMASEMSTEAQKRSKLSMELLDQTYSDKYTYPLWYTIEANMHGVDRQKARSLHTQGGHLTALQAVEYATDQDGTDEDALKNRLGNMTKAEIDVLRDDWERRHPGKSFDNMLRGELSGRDESDIMDTVQYGAPTSASQRVAQERRRTQRELDDLTGVFGSLAAGNEERWLRQQQQKLDDLEPQLFRTDLSDEEREVLRDELDYRIERVQAAVEDHRRAIDSVANLAAQVASMAVAITVGAILTAVSGGALGPVMIAVIASVAATLTTMGTKALIMGGSYGAEDIGVDLAVGVVDAITSAATAGMGGRILKGATGIGQRAAQPTRVTQLLGGLGRTGIGQKVAQGRAGQAIGRVASGFNKMESGFLTKGIQGNNILARMATGDNKALRFLAEGLAEGIENAASALPSAFAGTALDDNTWKGNPLANLVVGTATGVGTSVAMGGAMHGAKASWGHLKGPPMHLSTPEGRIAEANRILGDAFQQHRANYPDASYRDFLDSPAGRNAKAEVEASGLIGSTERAKLATDADARAKAEPDAAGKADAPGTPIENPAARAEANAEVDAARGRPESSEAGAEVRNEVPADLAQARAPKGDASVPANESKFTPEVPAHVQPADAAPARVAADADAVLAGRAQGEARYDGESGPRATPDAEAHSTVEGAPSKPIATDPASQQLRDGLPSSLTDNVEVKVNEKLDGNTVRVIPYEHGGPGRGVRVEVGPDATPTDVLLHSHTVQSMQRYQGLLGRLRQFRDWFNLTTVGTCGWEAKLELEKLPGIIHERMQQLSRGGLDIDAQLKLIDEINSLSRQIDAHQRVLESPELRDQPGRGFVAAEGTSKPKKVPGVREDYPPRDRDTVKSLPHKIVTNTPLADKGARVYQIGHQWQEDGRVYRRVVQVDAEGNIQRVREEIQNLDAHGKRVDRWEQRGSESSNREHGSGAVGEAGARMTVKDGDFSGIVDADGKPDLAAQSRVEGQERVVIDPAHLRNDSDNGFDGSFLRKNGENDWTMVLIEAKNQPAGIGLSDFSAVRGKRLQENIQDLLAKLKDETFEIKGLSKEHRDLMIARLERTEGNIEIQIHTTPDTPLGHKDGPHSSILDDLEKEANPRRKPGAAKPSAKVSVVGVPIAPEIHAKAVKEIQARDAIGEPSGRIVALGGDGVQKGSLEHRQAQSMVLAEGEFTSGLVKRHGAGQFIDDSQTLFTVITPTAHGARPGLAGIASDIWLKLRQPAPQGAKGQGKVIVDLSALSKSQQREVFEYLKHIQPKSLLDHVFIHDREAGKIVPFEPEKM